MKSFLGISALLCAMSLSCLAHTADKPQKEQSPREDLLMIFSGEWVSRAAYAATKLGIADDLRGGPKSIEEIALLTKTHPESLYRLLHMLAGFGLFEEVQDHVFANTKMSELLAKSHPDSLHALSLFYGEDIHESWGSLLESLHTNTPAFQIAFHEPVFNYFKNHPDRASLFQEAMREKTMAVIKSSLEAYDFGRFGRICDLGGGYGHFLQAILQKYPHMKGILFDTQEVIHGVPKRNPQLVHDRSECKMGDFFANVPAGADAYLLKSVLHDWDDEKAIQILKNCHKSMDEKGRILIVEVVVQPKNASIYANCMDMLMLAVTGGKERTLECFKKMLDDSGFVLEAVYPTATEFSILEAKKKI